MCESDSVEISINFSSKQGMLDLDTIEWFDPYLTNPPKENVLTYDKDNDFIAKGGDKMNKIHCDMARISEVEDSVCEWYDLKYFQNQTNEALFTA